MREISFKAKIINNTAYPEMSGEWYYGYYFQDLNESAIKHYLFNCPTNFEIDPETLCQFTGFYDKKGNKVYENDIVTFNKKPTPIKYFPKWGMFGFVGKSAYKPFTENDPLGSGGSSTSYKPYVLGEFYQNRIEIIGNTIDNPEILT